jgi:hypothetical protein
VFTESLTVQILGDSSELQRELELVAEGLDELQSRLSEASDAGRQIGEGLGRAQTAIAPLNQVSTLLNQISGQARQLSQQPITLNVQPALNALAQLSAMIQQVAAQLRTLGAGGGAAVPDVARPPRMPAPVPGFAAGGLVDGPAGIDQVPTWLTAGEFVISQESTRRLGTTFLHALNNGSPRIVGTPTLPATPAQMTHTTNNFGGITIEVTEAVEINDIVRDLRLQGAAIRNRRG